MRGKNVAFAIYMPLILMAIIAVIVIGIGETLLGFHEWAHEAYGIGRWATEEQNAYYEEIANLYPVGVALLIAVVILVGGSIATRIVPQATRQDTHH